MTETVTKKQMTLADLRKSDGELFVRNETSTVLTSSAGTASLQLNPKGTPDSIMILPKEIAIPPGFQRAWIKGLVSVTDDPDTVGEITLLTLNQNEAEIKQRAELDATIEEPASGRDLIEKKCLVSGETVWQTEADIKNGVPPLVERFKDEASSFIPTQVQGKNGPEYTFTKIK